MAKRLLRLHFRLPEYSTPRNKWRRQIHGAAIEEANRLGLAYQPEDRLQVKVNLYLSEEALVFHDIDNRLKDILDALQGRIGGSKSKRIVIPIIPNDKQIHRAIIEKSQPPKQSHGLGHVTVTKMPESAN